MSSIKKSVTLGDNLFIGDLTYINVNSVIGDAVFMNNGCIIEHDNVIGACSRLAPGVITGGGVIAEEESFIGLGTCVNDAYHDLAPCHHRVGISGYYEYSITSESCRGSDAISLII